MEERRKFVRCPALAEVTYTVLPSTTPQQTFSKDVSGGGSSIVTDKTLSPGTSLQVAMKLPSREQPVNFIGEVVWSQQYEIIDPNVRRKSVETGVRFSEIAPADQEAVEGFVFRHLRSII
jgi:c-di-GMP-binding flagellar brake protein YcgR